MTSRRLTFGILGALAVAAIAMVVVTGVFAPPADPVEHAIELARADDRYDTGLEAGKTLARVASVLNEGIRDCDRDREPDRCASLGAASGYVQVVAATVVHCTAPGRSEARGAVLEVLEAARTRRTGDPTQPPPPIPTCRR